MYPLKHGSFADQAYERGVYYFSTTDGSSSQNSGLLHNLCRRVCEPYLSYMDTNAPVLLDFLLLTQTRPFAVQVEPLISLEMSAI